MMDDPHNESHDIDANTSKTQNNEDGMVSTQKRKARAGVVEERRSDRDIDADEVPEKAKALYKAIDYTILTNQPIDLVGSEVFSLYVNHTDISSKMVKLLAESVL